MSRSLQIIFWLLGILSLVAGVVGIFVPLLPTTPFILLAAWCFARSSPRFHKWLIEHPRLGPIIHDWNTTGSIPISAKVFALAMIGISLVAVWILVDTAWARWAASFILVLVSLFLLSRPHR